MHLHQVQFTTTAEVRAAESVDSVCGSMECRLSAIPGAVYKAYNHSKINS